MAHRSREPGRAVRGKVSRPHDRGQKYVAPQVLPGERAGRWPKRGDSESVVSQAARRRRLARRGSAHELIKKLDQAILKQLSAPRVR
jgi:hypothetical protein